jgi:hypothetical protein
LVEDLVQLPLKGFHIDLKSDKPGWQKTLEGMGDGRFRVKVSKIKK